MDVPRGIRVFEGYLDRPWGDRADVFADPDCVTSQGFAEYLRELTGGAGEKPLRRVRITVEVLGEDSPEAE